MKWLDREQLARKVVQTPIADDAEVVIAWRREIATISGRVTCGGLPPPA